MDRLYCNLWDNFAALQTWKFIKKTCGAPSALTFGFGHMHGVLADYCEPGTSFLICGAS